MRLSFGNEGTRHVRIDPDQYRLPAGKVVKLRYFAGLSVEEAAETLGMSRASAYRHWTFARAWLLQELSGDEPADSPPQSLF